DDLAVGRRAKHELGRDSLRDAAGREEKRRLGMAGDARAGRLGDTAAARVDGQAAAAAAPAGRPVELHRRVSELAAEAGDAAHQAAVEDDAGAEACARRQDHERARAAPGAET